jgi:hypothetical protein
MADEQTDYLGLTDDSERKAAQGPAFVASLSYGPCETECRERMHRAQAKGCTGATTILFTEDDEGTLLPEHAEMWRVLLGWPRPPTADKVLAVKASRQARLAAAYWDQLRDAMAQDAADGFVPTIGPPPPGS